MLRGLYTASAGMMHQTTRQDAVANNLANCNTSGYKKDIVISSAFPGMLMSRMGEKDNGTSRPYVEVGDLNTGASMLGVFTDHNQGNFVKTDNPLDFAITGNGYFVLRTEQGERFTRDGQLEINAENILVNKQGIPVLDINDQTITIDGEYRTDNNGNIYIDDEWRTGLKVVEFNDTGTLRKEGNNWMSAAQPYTVNQMPQVKSGYYESSNVNAVSEMVTLISVVRSYEAMQKVVQAEDESLKTAIQVGSVAV